ncbi:transporter substrate-binding domain-containing protein [Neptuniibacter sp. CAU 1671]|uniref:substrate-binding periplasmic protein n=1 Tax=Neptuniibacter sp. CAU 1671 TaxID=3032593 RepID=UPI0023DA0259|nr:transporter substrate-binding domain-containing protein [Neptuniibacter sp. CAU 1671]MDF2181623.1 transporter substrate-binding domain-containing protein [Neptuniibacter sp. CAU 1671]
MRTILTTSVFTLLFMFTTLSAHAASTEICTQLTATGNSEYPPYLWREGKGDGLLGANRAIMDEIAKRLNISIKLIDVGSWARAQEMLKTGQIDLIAGAFYTVPRIQYMDYVYPAFLNTTSVVWQKKGSPLPYKTREDLIKPSVTTVINNSFGQAFDEYAKANLQLQYVASLEQALKMLIHDRTDFVLYEKNPGLAYAADLGLAEQVTALEPPISSEGLYLTISHHSDCNTGTLRGQLARVVQEMLAEGFMQKALQQSLIDWQTFAKQ